MDVVGSARVSGNFYTYANAYQGGGQVNTFSGHGCFLVAFNTITSDSCACIYLVILGLSVVLTSLSIASASYSEIGISISRSTITAYCGLSPGYTWNFAMTITRFG